MESDFRKLKENKKHGNFLLPFIKYDTFIPNCFSIFPMHWHDEMEIIKIIKGKYIVNINLKEYVVEEGDIVILKPCTLHSFKQYENEKMASKTIMFDLSMLNSNVTDACSIKYFTPFLDNKVSYPTILKPCDKGYKNIKECIDKLFLCYEEKNEFFELQLKSYLFELFYILFKECFEIHDCSTKIKDDTTNDIKAILEYIKINYMNPISIKDLANVVNFSEHYFMRFFKKYMGMTCIDYINEYRLNIATNLLETTDMSIMEIAVKVGVNNISYFNKIFKKKFNLTPKEYRKNLKKIKKED
ncbi:MAG: AraC family transcriptional regulator [Clostridium sp.]|nr:AraC family transcriptional regulator [Clostridium sp.]